MQVFNKSEFHGLRNIVEIDDLTAFIVALCQGRETEKNEIFLLGNMQTVELWSLVSYMRSLYDSSSIVHNVKTEKKRYFTLDISKAVRYGYSSKGIRTIIDELYQIQERQIIL